MKAYSLGPLFKYIGFFKVWHLHINKLRRKNVMLKEKNPPSLLVPLPPSLLCHFLLPHPTHFFCIWHKLRVGSAPEAAVWEGRVSQLKESQRWRWKLRELHPAELHFHF